MIRQLPIIRWTARSTGLKENFDRWLQENTLRQLALETEDSLTAPLQRDMRDLESLCAEFDPNIRVGDIRLLSAEFSARPERPVYVAILRDWKSDGFVTAVFSPFSAAGLSTELVFPERPHSLRVLCLWHHYELPQAILAKSWVVDQMTTVELDDAWHVFRHAFTDAPITESLAKRVGTYIESENDPRLAFQNSEIELLQPLANATLEEPEVVVEKPDNQTMDLISNLGRLVFGMTGVTGEVGLLPKIPINNIINRLTSIWEEYDRRGQLLAADSNPPLNASEEFQVVGSDLIVKFYLEADKDKTTVTVFDPEGELSQKLDGSMIIGTSGAELGIIEGGFSTISTADLKNGILLRSSSGQILELKRGS